MVMSLSMAAFRTVLCKLSSISKFTFTIFAITSVTFTVHT